LARGGALGSFGFGAGPRFFGAKVVGSCAISNSAAVFSDSSTVVEIAASYLDLF
jgi:hypothetical protein